MKKILLFFILVSVTLVWVAGNLRAVPNGAKIEFLNEGDFCFTGNNTGQVRWKTSFKEDPSVGAYPTTWAPSAGILGGYISVYPTPANLPVFDSTKGSYDITFDKPGKYEINVSIWYKADRTTAPLYSDEEFTRTFKVNFVKVKFKQNNTEIASMDIVKDGNENVVVETEPSNFPVSLVSNISSITTTGTAPGTVLVKVGSSSGSLSAKIGDVACKTLQVVAADVDVDVHLEP